MHSSAFGLFYLLCYFYLFIIPYGTDNYSVGIHFFGSRLIYVLFGPLQLTTHLSGLPDLILHFGVVNRVFLIFSYRVKILLLYLHRLQLRKLLALSWGQVTLCSIYMIRYWKKEKWGYNDPLIRTHEVRYWKMKFVANKFVSVVYYTSVE